MSADSDGFEIARALRLANTTRERPILLCASQPTRERVIRALAGGASQLLALAQVRPG